VAATDRTTDERFINETLDAWHGAAARADEDAYFAYFIDDAVFMGTDATERWSRDAFREYAHPHFAKGKAWSFRAIRRSVIFAETNELAWFDEDLATPNLGPARGSGVVVKVGQSWKIAHYNLSITVPNERFAAVKKLLESSPPSTESRIGQCNQIIHVINAEQQPIRDAAKSTNAAGMNKLADTLDAVANKVSRVELDDEKLVGLRNDYRAMVEDLSKVARETAAAMESQDPNKAQEAKKKMTAFGTRESNLIDSLNEYCLGD